jgi:hypothetical protein
MIEGLYCVQLYRVVDDFHYDSTTFWSFNDTDMVMSYMMMVMMMMMSYMIMMISYIMMIDDD